MEETPSYVPSHPDSPGLPGQVFASELETIRKRRQAQGIPPMTEDELPQDSPSPKRGLVGIGLSGGGIRSSSFNLGLLQAVEKVGLIPYLDYISTVSGGGYIGSCLSAIFSRSKKFPFRHLPGVPESKAFKHLRQYSNYLLPDRPFSRLRLPGLLLRGILINLLVVLPMLLLLAVSTVLLVKEDISEALSTQQLSHEISPEDKRLTRLDQDRVQIRLDLRDEINWHHKADFLISGLPQGVVIEGGRPLKDGSWLMDNQPAEPLRIKNISAPTLPSSVSVMTWNKGYSHGLVKLFPFLFSPDKRKVPLIAGDKGQYLLDLEETGVFRQYLLISGLDREAEVEGGDPLGQGHWLFSGKAAEQSKFLITLPHFTQPLQIDVNAWYSRDRIILEDPVSRVFDRPYEWTIGISIVFILALAFYPLAQASMKLVNLPAWRMRDLLTRYLCGLGLIIIGAAAIVESQPPAIYLFGSISKKFSLNGFLGGIDNLSIMAASLLVGCGNLLSMNFLNKGAGLLSKLALYATGIAGPVMLWILYLNFCVWGLCSQTLSSSLVYKEDLVLSAYLLTGLLVYLLCRNFYDINAFSIHPFYRDRLSRAFIFNTDPDSGRVSHHDEQTLSGLSRTRSPIHLINTTINLQGRTKVNTKGRDCEMFTFSRHWVGGPVTGYCKTEAYEKRNRSIDLATAMSISAAAAAPNMGRATMKSLTFIMALLNIRLGFWAKNPAAYASGGQGLLRRLYREIFPDRVGPVYLIREMFGMINEKSRYVNLSDGGHLENMGLYELVRRRCKYIIISDAEADPDMTFKGLAEAIRLIRIDMGIRIEMNTDVIAPKNGRSNTHFTLGKIHYAPDEIGLLLYIKSSFTGDENVYIKDYKARHPAFPHETTADQFFDEAQFEAYRALGIHAGQGVFSHETGRTFLENVGVPKD